jgi:hypothetical protein
VSYFVFFPKKSNEEKEMGMASVVVGSLGITKA